MKKLGLTILKALLFMVGWALLVSVLAAPKNENPAVWRFWAELLPLLRRDLGRHSVLDHGWDRRI